jgi:hypothetical protein
MNTSLFKHIYLTYLGYAVPFLNKRLYETGKKIIELHQKIEKTRVSITTVSMIVEYNDTMMRTTTYDCVHFYQYEHSTYNRRLQQYLIKLDNVEEELARIRLEPLNELLSSVSFIHLRF